VNVRNGTSDSFIEMIAANWSHWKQLL